ncbi:MAG TPA: DUF4097 family beta strand repeat-containing protein [Gemmatimonadaceae bacterium]|nr:DUF4097 family beta strand repeat-containing protein [Gemmatimonadaceae bacterium]
MKSIRMNGIPPSLVAVAMLCVLAVPASAQVNDFRGDRYEERVDTTVTIDRPGTVSLSIFSGRVDVRAGQGSQVRVRGTAERGMTFDATSASIRISSEPSGRSRGGAELSLTVPVGTRVVIEGHSATAFVQGVKGEVDAETVSGSISVEDAVGRVKAETVSGAVQIARVLGDVVAEAVNGRVEISNVTGNIEGESVSGRITITGAKSKLVRAESVNGRLSYSGSIDPTGNYKFTSHSGTLTLALPADVGATVSLETFNGNVDSDFPVTLQSGATGRHHDNKFDFKIGNGRARIFAETFNGDIRIQRGTDRE